MERLILSAWRAARRLEQEVLRSHGLTLPQYVALMELLKAGGRLPTGAWAERVSRSGAANTDLIDRLERNGWVSRVRCEVDRRVIEIVLTEPERLALVTINVAASAAGIAVELAAEIQEATGRMAGQTA